MAENNFDSTVASLFKGMDAFISAKTVNGATKLVNIKNQDTVTKILDMIPDVIDKFKGKDEKVVTDADIDEAIEDAAE